MNHIKLLACFICAILACQEAFCQTLNFRNLKKEDRHLVSMSAGLEHGLICGAAYSYQLKSKTPLLLNLEFSAPSGEEEFDDFKTKIGGQISLYQSGSFYLSGKFNGIYRKTRNDLVQLHNFGAELATALGYYNTKWFTAIEVGFDKAIVTRFKHSDSYKQIYPGAQDGWYEPATGGNVNVGILGGYSFKQSDIFLKGGILATQDFAKPQIPLYAQLGYTIRFRPR